MGDESLKESQNRHSAGSGRARNTNSGNRRTQGGGLSNRHSCCDAQLSAAGNKPLPRLSGSMNLFKNFLWFNSWLVVLPLVFSGFRWDKPGMAGPLSMESFITGFLNSMVVSGFQEGQPQCARAYHIPTCVVFSEVLLVKSSHWLSLIVRRDYIGVWISGSYFSGGNSCTIWPQWLWLSLDLGISLCVFSLSSPRALQFKFLSEGIP